MFPEVEVRDAADPCESCRRRNEDKCGAKGHGRCVARWLDRDVHLLSDGKGLAGVCGLDRLQKRRPFSEGREVGDDAVDDFGRGIDGRRGVYDTVGGMRVVCHGDE